MPRCFTTYSMSDNPYCLCHNDLKIVAPKEEDKYMGKRVLWPCLSDEFPLSTCFTEWYKQPAPQALNAFYLYMKNTHDERFYLTNSGSIDIMVCVFAAKDNIPTHVTPFVETEENTIHYMHESRFRIGMRRLEYQDNYYTASDCAKIPFKLVPVVIG